MSTAYELYPDKYSVQEKAIAEKAASLHEVSPRILHMFEAIRKAGRPTFHYERALLFTESFKQTEHQPLVLRWAKALKHIAENISVTILPEELIVGRPHNSLSRYAFVYPELDGSLMESAVENFSKGNLADINFTDVDKEVILNSLNPYWKGKDLTPTIIKELPEDIRFYFFGPDKENFIHSTGLSVMTGLMRHSQNWFHDFDKSVNRGFASIKEEAQKRLAALENVYDSANKFAFYEAVILTCDAIITLANRYSALAKELAKKESNPIRKKELETIAESCAHVPAYPARTFREGVQSQWFTQFFSRLEQNIGGQVGNGRMDQYLYPLYKKDLAEGKITAEEAEELFQCVWLHMWQSAEIKFAPMSTAGMEGFAHFEAVTIGGQKPNGNDATNDLSYIILKSGRALQCPYPEIGVRIHASTPDAFLHAVCEAIKDGKGTPKLINDECVLPFYLANNVDPKVALDYGVSGCIETRLPNKEIHATGNAALNYGSVVEFVLRNGRVKIHNDILFGKETGDPRNFKTYEEFWEAVKTQLTYASGMIMRQQMVLNSIKSRFFAAPFASCLHDLCMDAGMDLHEHAKYIPQGLDLPCLESIGFATIVDSLVAVKKLVYDDKKITMDELITALECNFEGKEIIRQLCLNAPKYGNNIPYADSIANDVWGVMLKAIADNPLPNGQYFMLRCIPITFHLPFGKVVFATPNGRKAGEYLSDGISASHGCDTNGPTAALTSYANTRDKGSRHKAADLLNMKFAPNIFGGETGTRRMMSFVRSWCATKLWHVQFNFLNRETLIAAQLDPEKYRNLVVRVAGYSAYFVELSKNQQNEIIARTEESFA